MLMVGSDRIEIPGCAVMCRLTVVLLTVVQRGGEAETVLRMAFSGQDSLSHWNGRKGPLPTKHGPHYK